MRSKGPDMHKYISCFCLARYETPPDKIVKGIRGAKPGVPHKKRKLPDGTDPPKKNPKLSPKGKHSSLHPVDSKRDGLKVENED